jgi:hypothetical protein
MLKTPDGKQGTLLNTNDPFRESQIASARHLSKTDMSSDLKSRIALNTIMRDSEQAPGTTTRTLRLSSFLYFLVLAVNVSQSHSACTSKLDMRHHIEQ